VARPISLVCASALLLSACGASSGSPHGTSADLVTVHGTLEMVGGPSGAHPDPVAGSVSFASGGRVTKAPAGADGAFTLSLHPGTYDVTGTSPSYDDGKALCRPDGPVRVITTGTATVLVLCQRR
jgi:hypothetical protein